MEPPSERKQPVPHSYREEREEKTLLMGRLFSILAIAGVAVLSLQDTILLRGRTFVVWGFIGLLPGVLFLLSSFTLFRHRRSLVIPLHFLSLLGVMSMTCGYTYMTFLLTGSEPVPGGSSPIVLVTTLFFLFVFASGARRNFAAIVLPPLAVLTGALVLHGGMTVAVLAHLSSAWIFAAAGIAASLAQDRVFHNEYTMRALAARRGEELELEIERARGLNSQLQREIEERKAIESELERRAAMDELTDVYNRRAGMEILTQSLYLAERNKQPLSVCFVDVDDLKFVNDNFGHAEGDKLLRHVITILKKHLRKSDYVSRIGGDEFIMVLPNCTRASAEYIIERIKDEFGDGTPRERPYPVNVSMGIAEFEGDRPIAPELLVRDADENMYRVKQAKKQGDRGA